MNNIATQTARRTMAFAAAALLAVAARTPAQTPPATVIPQLYLGHLGLTITGAVGSNYLVQCVTDLTQSNNWQTLTNFALPGSPYLWVDTSGAATNHLYYRVIAPSPCTPAGMVLIPAGSFVMGDTFGEGSSNELPLHTNHVSAFYMDTNLVSYALWQQVYNWAIANGYSFDYGAAGKAANHPAQDMTWYDAVKWCNARSEQEGRVPAYYTDAGLSVRYRAGQVAAYVSWSSGYRLPTEAEWEKAARGGASGQRFPWGNLISQTNANYYGSTGYSYDLGPNGYNAIGNYPATSPGTSPVGYFAANGYGLYDMAGNVFQWCWDWYGSYSSSSQTDPRGPSSGSFRVDRGGSWYDYAIYCRAADRYGNYPTYRFNNLGFRSVLPPGQ